MNPIKINVIPSHDFKIEVVGNEKFLTYEFRKEFWATEAVCTMHGTENWNNIEVLKLAVFCRLNNIKLTMFGEMNQLPLFSIFADKVILKRVSGFLNSIYMDVNNHAHSTTYPVFKAPPEMGVMDLSIESKFNPHVKTGINDLLLLAIETITDDQVVEMFANAVVWIRETSWKFFHTMNFEMDKIACEIKVNSANTKYIHEKLSAVREFDFILDRGYYFRLARTCGDHYMAVTMLLSLTRNWMWVCYGGSCNIFAFLPIKVILLSNALVIQSLSRKLSAARFGASRFPMFDDQLDEFLDMEPPLLAEIANFQAASLSPQSSVP